MSGKEDEDDDEEEEKMPTGQDAQDEYECKRRKRLELNRKAAQESRRRKKQRIEELQRSMKNLRIIFLSMTIQRSQPKKRFIIYSPQRKMQKLLS